LIIRVQAVLQTVPKFLRAWRRRSIRDAVVLGGLCLATYVVAATYDVFGQTYDFVKRYEAYELDELIVVAVVFGLLMAIYALRRVQDLKQEIQKRRDGERKSADHAVQLTTAVDNMSQGLLMFDSDERLVVCNERYHQMYNLSPEMVRPGATLLQLIMCRKECGSFKGDPNAYYAQLREDTATGQTTGKSIETPDGRTIHIITRPMADGRWVTTHEDITDKMRVKELIEQQAFQLDAALENMSQGLCMFDANQRLVVCNKRYADLYGLNEEQTRPGTTLRAILQHWIATGNAPDDHESRIEDRIKEVLGNAPHQITNRLRDGRYISIFHRPMADGGWVATHDDVTEAKRREESFRLLFDNNPVAMWVFDRETLRFLAVNDAAVTQYGYSREQFLTMAVPDIRAAQIDDSASFLHALPENQNGQYVGQHQRSDGTKIHVLVYSRTLNYEDQEARLVAIHDITDRKLAEDELHQTKMFLDTVIENVPMPILVKTVKDGRFALSNRASEELFGFKHDEVIGKSPHEIHDKQLAEIIVARDKESLLSDQPILSRDFAVTTRERGTRILISKRAVIKGDDGNPEYFLSVLDDVTERRQSEKRIAHMAHSDPLTDLPNRTAFNERLSAILNLAQAEHKSFAILCLDLDGFKEVNDIYGHAVGDMLLCRVADRLRSVADDAFIARLGGDEFTIIVTDADRPNLSRFTDHLLAAFVDDFDVDGHRLSQALSIGVAIYPNDGTDSKTLLSNADAALYQAKAEGSDSVKFFKAEMGLRLRERAALQADLKSAIQHEELHLHYQPQLKMNGKITGFESLARWNSPKRGTVPPGDFIPLAEESSLILGLGEWVLREACREAASWKNPLNIAVNVSPIQFRHGDLPRLVHLVLIESGLAAARLELEITEGVLVDDFPRAVSILRRLKSLGVRIVLDDFGSGYSSLSYLHAFPFDKIKIDRTFVSDLETNHHSVAIVRAVIGLGRSLKIPTLAEGVETQAQHAFLAKEGCDEVQGYLTGRPLAIADYAGVIGRKLIAAELAQAG
jgi:diguanylate cyclase (GGDEF)-like protein/PAS domain S-box-containing protein